MKAFLRNLIPPVAIAAMAIAPGAARAGVVTLSATYYTIGETDRDENDLAPGVFSNEVQNMLGPNGLPILNTTTYGCMTNCFTATPLPSDVDAFGELTWFSPTLNNGGPGNTSDVTQTGTASGIAIPYNNSAFFPPAGAGPNDSSGFQAAIFTSTLNVPSAETVSFSVGADDVAFVYLNGTLVCDLGGVHVDTPGTCTSMTLNAGNYPLEVFYADLHTSMAQLTFNVTTMNVMSGTPEPATWLLLAPGLAGLALLRRRRI